MRAGAAKLICHNNFALVRAASALATRSARVGRVHRTMTECSAALPRQATDVWSAESIHGGGQAFKKNILLMPNNWDKYDPFLMAAEDWIKVLPPTTVSYITILLYDVHCSGCCATGLKGRKLGPTYKYKMQQEFLVIC